MNLGEIPDYYRRFMDQVDIVVLKTRPMDEKGFFNFSATALWHRAVIESAKTGIVEVTERLPYVHGDLNGVHKSEVDYVIDGDDQTTPELLTPSPTDVDRAVGRLIASEITDGACLQIGIGGMPNAVCSLLKESNVQNLGIHTEMLTDGIVDLYKEGRITGANKILNPGKITFSFALGSANLYETLNRNTDFQCLPVDHTNPPHIIMQNERAVAITTQLKLIYRDRRRRNPTAIAISAAPAGNYSSSAVPML